jgi:hypothetical protein
MHDFMLPSSRITRLRNTARLPQQAALLARIPVVRGRVPMHAFWACQPVSVRGLAREMRTRGRLSGRPVPGTDAALAAAGIITAGAREQAPVIADRAQAAWSQAAPAIVRLGQMTRERSTRAATVAASMKRRAHLPRGFDGPWLRGAAIAAAGGLFMFYFDPISGRRRRAMMGDRFSRAGHAVGRIPRRLGRRGRFARGVARGVAHGTKTLVGANGRRETVDEEMLVARVRSEVFRDEHIPPGEINIDAYEGCVTLRGQLRNESEIRRLVAATKSIDGVIKVRSYLHLPDELPPNKSEMYEHSEQHLPSM